MEITGGEPDVVSLGQDDGKLVFSIALKKAPQTGEAYATTVQLWKSARQTSH